jgi:hypothetical protein
MGGLCQPQVVASNARNLTGICDVEVVDNLVYFSEPAGIWSVPTSGGVPASFARAPEGTTVTPGLASTGTDLYWNTSNARFEETAVRSPLRPTEIGEQRCCNFRFPFGSQGDRLGSSIYHYVVSPADPDGVSPVARSIEGWSGQPIVSIPSPRYLTPGYSGGSLCSPTNQPYAVDRKNLYYVVSGDSIAPSPDEVWQVPLSGGAPIRIHRGRWPNEITVVVGDETHVYVGGRTDAPRRFAVDRPDARPEYLDQPTDGASMPPTALVQIVVDDAHVYWASNDADETGTNCGNAVIRRQAKTLGSSPSVIVHQQAGMCMKDLVSDGATLYWSQGPSCCGPTADDEILKVAK